MSAVGASIVRHEGEPLAPFTTLELGGPARELAFAETDADVAALLEDARARGLRVAILGGGSNLVVADEGWDGLVIAMRTRGVELARDGELVSVTAAAGEVWDALVERTVEEGLAGLECLSGIPGSVGATPIQNVGAYGQDVAETIACVHALDRRTGEVVTLGPEDCAFGYRDSALKRDPDRFVVLRVTFALRPGGAPAVRYAELERALPAGASLDEARRTVLELRARKSMVLRQDDPNRRSAGSFFTNPVVSAAHADALTREHPAMPRWVQPSGEVKLAAGWLIEHAGVARGMRRGAVGVSSAHALALVHHGGGTTTELLALADEIIARVREAFGVVLVREPVLWGAPRRCATPRGATPR